MHASLQEQLRATLNKWEREERAPAPAKPSPFQVSNNLNRAAFQEIKDNPDTRKKVTDRLIARGYKLGSVSAVIGHMLRQGVAQLDDEGVLHVTTAEYVPLKSSKTLQNMRKKAAAKQIMVDVRKREVRPVSASSSGKAAGITALSPAPAPAPIPAKPWSVYGLLETLSILQARDLYDELKKIFEVNK